MCIYTLQGQKKHFKGMIRQRLLTIRRNKIKVLWRKETDIRCE